MRVLRFVFIAFTITCLPCCSHTSPRASGRKADEQTYRAMAELEKHHQELKKRQEQLQLEIKRVEAKLAELEATYKRRYPVAARGKRPPMPPPSKTIDSNTEKQREAIIARRLSQLKQLDETEKELAELERTLGIPQP